MFHEYAPRNLKIRDKAGKLIPFKMNRPQLFLHHVLEQQLKHTGRIRVIILKGRQMGVSTYTEGRFYWKTTFREGCRTFILSHEQTSTNTLFDMVQTYHEHCAVDLKLPTERTNRKELIFSLVDSTYELGTAGKKDVGRSKRITNLHWSEVASSPNAADHKKGIVQTVPELPDTEIVKESTANGVGGQFHEDWLEAVKSKSWRDVAIFIPWHWQDEYRTPIDDEWIGPDEEEQALAEEFNLDEEQLYWRRLKIASIKSDVGSKEDAFKQEYPMTWQEAFLYSGAPRFSPKHMEIFKNKLEDPKLTYQIDTRDAPIGTAVNFRTMLKKYKLVPDAKGPLKMWERPDPLVKYVIGADVAKGLEHGDNSSAHVVNITTGRTAAGWAGKIPSSDFGDLLAWLGATYNKAEVIVEITGGFGDATVQRLNALHYPRIYQAVTRTTDGSTKKQWGYDTTKNSKPILIDALDEDLIYEPGNLLDKMLWYEMSTYVRKFNENNPHMPPKMEAMEGKHDDRVISRALASFLYHQRAGKVRINPKLRKQREKINEVLKERQKGQKLFRTFFNDKGQRNVRIVPAAKQRKLQDPNTVAEMLAEVKDMRAHSPALDYEPVKDVAIEVEKTNKVRRSRRFGD